LFIDIAHVQTLTFWCPIYSIAYSGIAICAITGYRQLTLCVLLFVITYFSSVYLKRSDLGLDSVTSLLSRYSYKALKSLGFPEIY